MPQPVAHVGATFSGSCAACDGAGVSGVLTTGNEYFAVPEGQACFTGDTGVGGCGHTCTVQGISELLFFEGRAIARQGDPVTGTISGVITSGSELIRTD